MLLSRIIGAALFAPLMLLATCLGGVWFLALLGALALIACHEFRRLNEREGRRPSFLLMASFSGLLMAEAQWGFLQGGLAGPALAVALSLLWFLFQDRPDALLNWALTWAGIGYIGVLLSHGIMLRGLVPMGLEWTLAAILATWACDTAAYFTGRWAGRRPFFPRISPKKTWEGTLGGWAGAMAVAGGMGMLLGLPAGHSLGLGAILGPAATAGDLVESMIKRQVGAKDSGTLIPGHGGVLDRMDSLIFVFPVAYYFVTWVVAR